MVEKKKNSKQVEGASVSETAKRNRNKPCLTKEMGNISQRSPTGTRNDLAGKKTTTTTTWWKWFYDTELNYILYGMGFWSFPTRSASNHTVNRYCGESRYCTSQYMYI